MVKVYQLRSPVAGPAVAPSPSRRLARSRSQAPHVPRPFKVRRSSRGLPFGGRGPVLPYRCGPLRWVVSWASRSYMAAVVGGSGFRRAIAWRFMAIFAGLKWAHTYVWWVKQVTEVPAE